MVSIDRILPERCWASVAAYRFTFIGMWSSASFLFLVLLSATLVCCMCSGCPFYWKRVALSVIDRLLGIEDEESDRIEPPPGTKDAGGPRGGDGGKTGAFTQVATSGGSGAALPLV